MKRRAAVPAILALAMFSAACSSTPSGTVRKLYHSIEVGDVQKAMQYISASDVSNFGSKIQAGLVEQGRAIQAKGGIQSINIISEEINGDVASVVAEITYKNGQVQRERNKLRREQGKWRLTSDK